MPRSTSARVSAGLPGVTTPIVVPDGAVGPTKALTRESALEEWAQRIERWRRDHDVYAYFNNDREGFAVRNALRLKVRNALRLKERLGV
jgi:uncharacterized protein YecE (DUF72 family)